MGYKLTNVYAFLKICTSEKHTLAAAATISRFDRNCTRAHPQQKKHVSMKIGFSEGSICQEVYEMLLKNLIFMHDIEFPDWREMIESVIICNIPTHYAQAKVKVMVAINHSFFSFVSPFVSTSLKIAKLNL